ncbi:hypothetical protein Hanom_Chr16g01514411 [Helianthus anomalus]
MKFLTPTDPIVSQVFKAVQNQFNSIQSNSIQIIQQSYTTSTIENKPNLRSQQPDSTKQTHYN